MGGVAALVAFAALLALVPSATAGRGFAAYGGVYIVFALGYAVVVERLAVTWWDGLGVLLCLLGALVLLSQGRGLKI